LTSGHSEIIATPIVLLNEDSRSLKAERDPQEVD
jgi:hypothetical protein